MLNEESLAYCINPVQFAIDKLQFYPDPIQARILSSNAHYGILCCTRQWGKSTVAAAKAVHMALYEPQSTILVAGPTERQAAETVYRCARFLSHLGIRRRGDGQNRVSLVLPNGSRIIGLPHSEERIRCFSAPALILIDEAAAVSDALYNALLPMQATNPQGAFWILSTPRQKRGFFYQEWIAEDNGYTKFSVTAPECPRISQSWLQQQEKRMPKAAFDQEFLCVFRSSHNSLIDDADIETALRHTPTIDTQPLRVYLGLDLGQRADHAALTVLYLQQSSNGLRDPITYNFQIQHRLSLQQIHQIPLGTSYPDIARLVRNTLNHPDLQNRTTLVVDAGGPGLPFIDFLITQPLKANLIKINITGSTGAPTHNRGQDQVSRSQLLTNLSLLLQNRALKLPQNDLLLTELRGLQSNFTSHADHDDIVMSLALAAWQATKNCQGALV
jgi:hypothetical protein